MQNIPESIKHSPANKTAALLKPQILLGGSNKVKSNIITHSVIRNEPVLPNRIIVYDMIRIL